MKYQCNSCGKVHEYRSDAVNCHPDINEIPDEQLESRLAAQRLALAAGLSCRQSSVIGLAKLKIRLGRIYKNRPAANASR